MRYPLLLLFAVAFVATAQIYNGPRPEKPDLPYLKHADQLVPTEATEAKEEKGKKEEITYVVAGAASAAKTPLASPVFLLQTDKLTAGSLQLYKLESRNGRAIERRFKSSRLQSHAVKDRCPTFRGR